MTLALLCNRQVYSTYHLFWKAVDWLYPPICASCRKPGMRLCTDCYQKIKTLNNPVCPICGRPYNSSMYSPCEDCLESPPSFQALRSWGYFIGPLREAIHGLKYKRDIGLGDELAKNLIDLFSHLQWKVDLITPVPLSEERLEERGYNQSHYLALPLALKFQIPYKPHALRRIRNTVSQVGLDSTNRKQNMQGAFRAEPKLVSGKNILIIDDVTTTGATIEACSAACKEAQANTVFAMTLARTRFSMVKSGSYITDPAFHNEQRSNNVQHNT